MDKLFTIPNILSMSRGAFLPVLFYFIFNVDEPNMKIAFIIGYTLLGLTDVFDGRIARKYNMCSELGSNIDSYADILFGLSSVFFVYVLAKDALVYNLYLILIALVGIVSQVIISSILFKKPKILHTLLSKTGGVFAFFTVLLSAFINTKLLMSFTLILYVISFIENIVMFLLYGNVSNDIKSIFHARKKYKEKKNDI